MASNTWLSAGMVDGNRVAIAGGSYGGLWQHGAVTQTTRSKEAIYGGWRSDFHSFPSSAQTSPIGICALLGLIHWRHPEVYSRPFRHHLRLASETATLILHGQD